MIFGYLDGFLVVKLAGTSPVFDGKITIFHGNHRWGPIVPPLGAGQEKYVHVAPRSVPSACGSLEEKDGRTCPGEVENQRIIDYGIIYNDLL